MVLTVLVSMMNSDCFAATLVIRSWIWTNNLERSFLSTLIILQGLQGSLSYSEKTEEFN